MNFKPLGNRVLVERTEQEEKTAGGIIIPDTAKEKPAEGRVVAVGEGSYLDNGSLRAMPVKENDIILFAKWAGNEIKLEGKEYLIVKEDEIFGIVNKK